MREYKFRAKSTDESIKDWLYGFGVYVVDYVDGSKSYHLFTEHGNYDVIPETVGQYTGLKDKNGVEIYEGDILTAEYYPFQDEGKHNYHAVVEWIDECAAYYLTKRLATKEKRGMSDGIAEPIDDISEFEIIGNIYDHKHLLNLPGEVDRV